VKTEYKWNRLDGQTTSTGLELAGEYNGGQQRASFWVSARA
jgi:hypothetical protein